jgi:hypothetical protein
MYDEVHFQNGLGPAKRMQLEHGVVPADLAVLIAATIPGLAEQEAIGRDQPADEPNWPWPTEEALQRRIAEARAVLAARCSKPASNRR